MAAPTHAPLLPTLTPLNRPFWEACAAGELRLQVCQPCGHVRYPISAICPRCLSPRYTWEAMSGRGEILSWVVFRRGYHPAWNALVPYNVVLVQLPEGPRMFGNVLPLERQYLTVGDVVQVAFDRVAEGIAVPRWEPVPGRRSSGARARSSRAVPAGAASSGSQADRST